MSGKLYLRNIRNCSNVPEGTMVINIARGNMPIKNRMLDLAPSSKLLNWYLNNRKFENWFDIYKPRYYKEIKNNPNAIKSLLEIELMLKNGQNVCLVCFCESHTKCHRGIIGDWFKRKDYEVLT